MIKCFMLEPAGTIRQSLRRYHSSADEANACPLMPGSGSYHNAATFWRDVPEVVDEQGHLPAEGERPPREDPTWPTACGCGYVFADTDEWQVFQDRLYRRADTGEIVSLRGAPPGAMWHADWMLPHHAGPDGHVLMVMTPGGEWMIDGRASNCTLPEDNEHRCWVRHGTPPDITVDKNGLTCNAGAGSIQAGSYHGFLQNGYLT